LKTIPRQSKYIPAIKLLLLNVNEDEPLLAVMASVGKTATVVKKVVVL